MSETKEKKKATPKDDQPPKTIIAQQLHFRNLTAEEIDVRVARINANSVELLLYKDARCDMNILDETVGPENWTRDHKEIRGSLFCTVGIRIVRAPEEFDGRIYSVWVYKTDCGAESNMEPVKGVSSDSFKRACFNWGIGRELYTAPRIKTEVVNISNGRCYDHFSVEHIQTDEAKNITELSIVNDTSGKRAFAWSKMKGVIPV